MIEARSELRLDEEALAEALVLCPLGRDQLKGDRASKARIVGAINDAHAAATNDSFDLVTGQLVAGMEFFARGSGDQRASVSRGIRKGNLRGEAVAAWGARIHSQSIVGSDDTAMTWVRRPNFWLGAESPVMSWRIGDAVDFRNGSWVVLDRTEEGESLSLMFGVAA